jgi:phenylpropionate dioxygenase-like ring-hydroxylating dioxygenase large terminal subunit
MLTREQNELITRTGPDTPCGKLFRQYWQPIAMLSDVPDDAPLAIRALGEQFVLFRDEAGRLGLLDLHCPHRGADLSYGRLEDGGLRCLYHGWVFDVTGKCLQQPAEPPGKDFCHVIQQRSYPLRVLGGMIFAYLGEGEPPAFPEWECLLAADNHRFVVRSRERCNWLQGLEGDIDPYHLSFLHLALPGARKQLSEHNGGRIYEFFRHGTARMEVERTDYGVRIYALRDLNNEAYLRISNFVNPNIAVVAGSSDGDGYMALWHVPIDDYSHFKYQLIFKRVKEIDVEAECRQAEMQWDPKFPNRLPTRNQENRWLQDRKDMKDGWFAGMGPSFGLHDNWATEAMGPIYDRSKEHLGHGDKAIIGARRTVLAAIETMAAGNEPPFRFHDAQALKQKLTEIVVASLISPDKDNYREVFYQEHLAATKAAAAE